MSKKTFALACVILLMPSFVLAQAPGVSFPPPIEKDPLTFLIGTVWPVVSAILWTIAAAFVVTMFSIAGLKFLTAQGDLTKIAEARKAVIWGTVGTAVIVLAWSVVSLIRATLGV